MTADIIRRIAALEATGNANAAACAADAVHCLRNAATDETPGTVGEFSSREAMWTDAARRWVARGASHVWGFNLPQGW